MLEISHTNTGGCSEVSFVAHVTLTAEGSDTVDALTVSAQIWHHMALVDIWKYSDILKSHKDAPQLDLFKKKFDFNVYVIVTKVLLGVCYTSLGIITVLLTSTICGEARSKWAHLLVLYGAGQWAELTL